MFKIGDYVRPINPNHLQFGKILQVIAIGYTNNYVYTRIVVASIPQSDKLDYQREWMIELLEKIKPKQQKHLPDWMMNVQSKA